MEKGEIKKPLDLSTRNPEPVPIDAIDLNPGGCCMSYGFDLEPLKESLRLHGLLNTPLVREKRGRGFGVVSGYRRVLALKALGSPEIPCRILAEREMDDLQALLLNLHENLAARRFNEVEKAMVIARLSMHLAPREILKTYMPLLGLHSRPSVLEIYRGIENDLDSTMKQALVRGSLSVQAAGMLLELEKGDRKALFEWLIKFKFNMNQMIQAVDLIIDISSIEGVRIARLLKEDEFSALAEEGQGNRPQQARHALSFLRAKRFPRLTRMEQGFRKRVSGLNLPPKVRIQHPPGFESTEYRMEIVFENGSELADMIRFLSSVSGLERICEEGEGGGR
ncbi:MAG: ParB N-terminal domain-containing protein [Deltaproteobacteria bacterium]|nr:ParB N-terminal domain-containing protein [Deltaproteobacteria bacterium]MBW1924582.1 ParB N-terminal domain-containing protein [Deltaproteobacteria bacterium]MBW1950475.1 ParB N-terminal domain-containing protein [Deltaproteobacteria bacterium]MBW2009169.1 ParB N-terminal domain-containing protein [Deltaproteobacteria bacterium]MBW2103236.1 ParB N-terminal domain-containing protein [Deltaproteobacteria bacterium]